MNETLAGIIVARLKQDGNLSLEELESKLSVSEPGELERTLKSLVSRGDVRRSRRDRYYVSGFVTPPVPKRPRTKRAAKCAIAKFGVETGSGLGFEVDGKLVMPGDVQTHQELMDLFRVSNMGGIRVSKTVGAVVLISSTHNDLYKDRQQGDVFRYTGEGRHGDQTLARGNKAIADSPDSGTPLLLFFKRDTNEYEFQGEVRLAGEPEIERQLDEDGLMRDVWVFLLETV